MTAMGQRPLFMVRPRDSELDALLAARGHAVTDPVVLFAAPVAQVGPPPTLPTSLPRTLPPNLPPDPIPAFAHWPPLQIARMLWAEGGIGPERLAVMDRVALPKTAILARSGDRPSGVAFVARSSPVAFLHALEVTPPCRRQGSGGVLLRAAAQWAAQAGCGWLALAVTRANVPACSLYASLGMRAVGQYHYRTLPA